MGEVTVTNTEKLPYVLPAHGIRVAITRANSTEQQYVNVTCPDMVSNIIVRGTVGDVPGTLVCEFKAPIDAAWKKGAVQAQLQTLLSLKFEVDSGIPKPYDFAETAGVQTLHQGECVSVKLTRVTNPVDLQTANANPAVATLAQTLGGSKFKLLPMGVLETGGARRVPPAANDEAAQPLVVCGNETVAWRETYGPWSELDCGPSMVSAVMSCGAVKTSCGSSGFHDAKALWRPCRVAPCEHDSGYHSLWGMQHPVTNNAACCCRR